MTDANGNTTTYEYNNWGKLTKVTDPMGYEKTYTYNLNYDLASETDKNGNTISYQYDPLRRVSKKNYPDDTEESYSYNANGNLISITDKNGTIIQSYDKLNRLTKVVDVFGQEISYTYYPNGNKKIMIDPQGGITTYGYYRNGLLKSVTDPAGYKTEYFYQNKLLDRVVYPNNTETNYVYDLNDRIIDLVNKKSGGEIISTFHYEYDPVGNRLTLTTSEGIIAYTYDKNNRILSAGATTYTYDNNGNQITKTEGGITTTFQYDYKNQLIKIEYNDGHINEFRYNTLGQRITKIDNTGVINFIYDGLDLLMETREDGVVIGRYTNGLFGTGPISKRDATDEYRYFLKDALLTVTQLTDGFAEVMASYTYDIFGAIKSATVVDDRGIRQRFTGKELDQDSNLLYFGARYYNPSIGRFISADSFTWGPDDIRRHMTSLPAGYFSNSGAMFPVKLNQYTLCGNNPINYIDLTGNESEEFNFWNWLSIGLSIIGVVFAIIFYIPAAAGIAIGATTLAVVAKWAALVFGLAGILAGLKAFSIKPSFWGGVSLLLGLISLLPALGVWGVVMALISIVIAILTAQLMIPAIMDDVEVQGDDEGECVIAARDSNLDTSVIPYKKQKCINLEFIFSYA